MYKIEIWTSFRCFRLKHRIILQCQDSLAFVAFADWCANNKEANEIHIDKIVTDNDYLYAFTIKGAGRSDYDAAVRSIKFQLNRS